MKLIVSNIDRWKWDFGSNSFGFDFTTEQTIEKIKLIFDLLKENYEDVSEDNDTEKFILYFRAPKGRYEDDTEYRYYLRDGSLEDANLIKRYWDRDYPYPHKWFSFVFRHTFYRNINYYSLFLDSRKIFSVSDEKYAMFEEAFVILLKPVLRVITRHIKLNSDGKYKNIFDKTFGYGKRRGIISYKDAWKIYPSLKRKYFHELKGVDLKNIFLVADSNEITYFPKLSSGKYYDICKIGYLGVDKTIDKDIDSRTLFYQKADGRTFDLEKLDINDEEGFDAWFEENGEHPDHAFEIFRGRSFYRGDLWIEKDDKGYYLSLSGSNYHTQIDILKFYSALLKEGIKVKLIDKELYKTRLDGSAYFAIENEDNWCYDYTTVFGESYIDSIHIEDFPKLIPYVDWEEVLFSKFIGGGKI